MGKQRRPLRELCQALTAVELVKSGLPTWGRRESASVKLLGPASHGIRAPRLFAADYAPVFARMERVTGGFARGTLQIGSPFSGHVWVDEVAVKIPPYRHWLLRCQGCNQQCRTMLWPPGGPAWRCRRCLRVRYPDKRRIETMLPRPDAADPLDELERGIRRMRLIRDSISSLMRRLPSK